MDFPYGETVTIQAAAEGDVDPYSNEPSLDWENPVETVVEGVGVEPRPSQEPVQDARNAVTSGYTLYLPSGVTITSRSRVVVRGEVYGVLGEPAVWRSPFTGWEPGVVVQLERTEG